MRALRLLWASLNVRDLLRAERFYVDALGFSSTGQPVIACAAMAGLLGAQRVRMSRLRRGGQTLELAEMQPESHAYPEDGRSNDAWFQHCALVTEDIANAYARLNQTGFRPISDRGPQALPGGIVAFKFRDPDGHPLELIQFPAPNPRTFGGIDHCALAVADAARSAAYYENVFGLSCDASQVNCGPAQDALDGLDGTCVDVVALAPADPAPHLELLGYRAPAGRARKSGSALARVAFDVDSLHDQPGAVCLADGSKAALFTDPDGHTLLASCGASSP